MDLDVRKITWWQRSLVKVLRNGPIPKHIGFIMDGNRRFARNANMVTIQGHEMGERLGKIKIPRAVLKDPI